MHNTALSFHLSPYSTLILCFHSFPFFSLLYLPLCLNLSSWVRKPVLTQCQYLPLFALSFAFTWFLSAPRLYSSHISHLLSVIKTGKVKRATTVFCHFRFHGSSEELPGKMLLSFICSCPLIKSEVIKVIDITSHPLMRLFDKV